MYYTYSARVIRVGSRIASHVCECLAGKRGRTVHCARVEQNIVRVRSQVRYRSNCGTQPRMDDQKYQYWWDYKHCRHVRAHNPKSLIANFNWFFDKSIGSMRVLMWWLIRLINFNWILINKILINLKCILNFNQFWR